MALKCGIVGLPNVGKSTLFNCLSNAKAQAANYPFCTIEPNVGTISVPDSRLTALSELVTPEKLQPTTIEIVDIAGLVKGASKGEGLGNKFLANIRETDAIIHVLRCFKDENITHVNNQINPINDKEIIESELQIKDLESLEKKIEGIKRKANSGDKQAVSQLSTYEKYHAIICEGKMANTITPTEEENIIIKELNLLTNKPIIYICNVDENSASSSNEMVDQVKLVAKEEGNEVLVLCVQIESDIAGLESFEDKKIFLEELGVTEPGINKLIRSAYQLLNLQTFFTVGKKEVRAWTTTKGATAPQSAGVIHTDFEKGFIRAEVIKYKDYIDLKSEQAVKEAGKLRVEGKTYLVEDGDIMHFRFNT